VGFVLVYDVTSAESLKNCVKVWLPQVKKHATNDNCPIFLLGTKTDVTGKPTIHPTSVRKIATTIKARPLYVSSKLSDESKINGVFEKITQEIYNLQLRNKIKPKESLRGQPIEIKPIPTEGIDNTTLVPDIPTAGDLSNATNVIET